MTRALLLLPLLVACGRGAEERPPYRGAGVLDFDGGAPNNLLFLSIDTLRRDHLGYHAGGGLTPFLDGLAAEGMVADDVQQCSAWTLPGTTCALAGSTSLERDWTPALNNASGLNNTPTEDAMLADWLGEAGFWTGLVCSNLWLSPQYGNGQGYDEYVPGKANALDVGDEGLAMLRKGPAKDQRWFLHLHHMEPHWPYTAPPEFVEGLDQLEPWSGGDLRGTDVQELARDAWDDMPPDEQQLVRAHMQLLYDAEVRAIDARLAETWANLDAKGWLDDTLVVIWSDHGEQVWEHGWKGHAYGLHADENDATMLFWAKDIAPGSFDEPASIVDLVPTVLDVMGVPISDAITGEILGTADPERVRSAEVLGYDGIAQSVTVGDDKLIFRWPGELELYDRSTDRAEAVNLYTPGDATAAALWEALRPRVEHLDGLLPAREPTWPTGI